MNATHFFQCRLCAKNCESGYSLFDDDVVEIIESFTPIKIEENDNLPTFCCGQCLADVYLVCKIRTRIIDSDKALREELLKHECPDDETLDDADLQLSPASAVIKKEDEEVVLIGNDVVHIEVNPDLDKITLSGEKSDGSPTPNQCVECNKTFTSRKLYQQHLSSHNIVSVCKICGTQVLTVNYRRHLLVHKGTPQVCELCGAVAKNAESLRGHMFYMHKSTAEQYKCKQCNKCYRYKYKYKLHLRKAHGGDRSHICEVCGKAFYTARDVNRHIQMTHMKLRPYICQYCNKGFSSSYARRTHVRQHTNEKPFKCEVCAEGFRQRVSLKTHLKSKHGIYVVEKTESSDSAVQKLD